MNKHSEPLFQKSNVSPPGMINFSNIFITPPKTFQFDLGVAGKEILTLSALYRSCQFLPLSDRTICPTLFTDNIACEQALFLSYLPVMFCLISHTLLLHVSHHLHAARIKMARYAKLLFVKSTTSHVKLGFFFIK